MPLYTICGYDGCDWREIAPVSASAILAHYITFHDVPQEKEEYVSWKNLEESK